MSDPRSALEAIGRLPDVEIDIADAALQFARDRRCRTPTGRRRARICRISRATRSMATRHYRRRRPRGRGRACSPRLLAGAATAIAATTETYDDLANANLIRVIERRQGLPVALGVIWLHAAARPAGARTASISPAISWSRWTEGAAQVVLDVFNGGAQLDARDLRALIKRVEGEKAELRPGLLQPMRRARRAAAAAEQHQDPALQPSAT